MNASDDPPQPLAHVCVLTPEGRGAVAVLRLWGPKALDVAERAFRPARGPRLTATPPGRPRLGRIGAGLGDEVVVVLGSLDPIEVEIHCHGGPAATGLVIDALVAAGARRESSEVWARRSTKSAVEAAALGDLALAPTVRTAEILLDQVQGALGREVETLAALVEVDPERAIEGLDLLIQRSSVGLRLVSGWKVVLAGRPNVGKSRLLNALAGYDRAIVDSLPGTTRDVVTFRTALDGWPVEFADTAGLRASDDVVELLGIALAMTRRNEADLVVLVLDRSRPLSEEDSDLSEWSNSAIKVANKADLPPAWETGPDFLTTSALSGLGIENLGRAIVRKLVPDPPPPGAGVPFRPAYFNLLIKARAALQNGNSGVAARQLQSLGIDGSR